MALDEDAYFEDREERLIHSVAASEGISRRRLLQLAAAGLPVLAGLGRVALPSRAGAAGAIVKPLPPEWFIPLGTNAEMRWDAVPGLGYTIPNERFFVRNHIATPIIDPSTWRLNVFGSGLRKPEGVTFSLRDLKRFPARTVTAFIECAGNGRSFFGSQQATPVAGSQWKLGAIGVARWRGVPLADVLERAGITHHAIEVMPAGLDAEVADQGHVRRPLPVEKALDDVLLAYEMNGEPLPPDHGAPLRLVVPGWVGVASIKWVGSIEVADQPLYSTWNTTQYRLTGPTYPADQPPLSRQAVKSAFELPFGVQLRATQRHVLTGRSWSGSAPIRRVDVSTDGGHDFAPAQLQGPNLPNAWVRWHFPFEPRTPGAYELQARATDARGQRQPATVPFNDGGYLFWAVVKHPVQVIA
jgi:DMSO/TMAO reductase YedYZ molybdopterin-dependent catalytic subunit